MNNLDIINGKQGEGKTTAALALIRSVLPLHEKEEEFTKVKDLIVVEGELKHLTGDYISGVLDGGKPKYIVFEGLPIGDTNKALIAVQGYRDKNHANLFAVYVQKNS